MVWMPDAPLKVMVELPAVKIPEFTQSPEMLIAAIPLATRVPFIIIFLVFSVSDAPTVKVIPIFHAKRTQFVQANNPGLEQVHRRLARRARVLLVLGGIDDGHAKIFSRNGQVTFLVAVYI